MIKRALFVKGSEDCERHFNKTTKEGIVFLVITVVSLFFISTAVGIFTGIVTILTFQLALYYARRYIDEKKLEEKKDGL